MRVNLWVGVGGGIQASSLTASPTTTARGPSRSRRRSAQTARGVCHGSERMARAMATFFSHLHSRCSARRCRGASVSALASRGLHVGGPRCRRWRRVARHCGAMGGLRNPRTHPGWETHLMRARRTTHPTRASAHLASKQPSIKPSRWISRAKRHEC
jgi:hypothetical protein